MNGSAAHKLLKNTTHFTQPLTSLQCGKILQSLTNSKSLSKGQQLHAHMTTNGTLINNTYLSTKLTAFYANCGRMNEAQFIFNNIAFKSSFLWNFMIRGYVSNGCPSKALALYREMIDCGIQGDKFTYPFVIKACGDLGVVGAGKCVHGAVVVGGYASDLYVGNCVLSMYSKFGDMESPRKVFDRMSERDLTSWNTMIMGYVRNGDPMEGIAVFKLMRNEGVAVDDVTLIGLLSACCELKALKQGRAIHGYLVQRTREFRSEFLRNSLTEMYCSCGSMGDARQLFEEVVGKKDIVSWNSMISGYAQNNDAAESLRLFCRLVGEGWDYDQVTLIAVLKACVEMSALLFGMSVHSCLLKKAFGSVAMVGTALIDMYSKCGSLGCSRLVFDELPEKNLISWSAMITGYGAHGRGKEAICIFSEMIKDNNLRPDDSLFVSVLSACSHAGLINEGKEIFYRMTEEYKIEPTADHYSCIVDLLGRAGHLDEAYELIKNMDVRPTTDIWAALLSACRQHRNVKLAEIAAQKIFYMNPNVIGSYVCLSNIYAAEKRWDDVERLRAIMRKLWLKKPPGCSSVEIDKIIHQFLVGDRSHQQTDKIYSMLSDLKQRLKKAGYKPDTSSVFYDVEEELKEKILWEHSEKLAIAFALINTSPGSIIRVTKNLRVCVDCHTVTKFISKILCREIIMRDIRRFHHFKDGVCSCGDYW